MSCRIGYGIGKTHAEKQSISRPREGVCGLLKKRVHEMSIKTIPRSEFDRLLAHNPGLKNLMVEPVEWFSNRSGNLLGSIAEGEHVAGCNYAILKRDKKGDFHIRKMMSNFFNLKAARVDLLLSMAETAINQPALPVLLTLFPPSGSWLTEPARGRIQQAV
jgi:hypothetical protein